MSVFDEAIRNSDHHERVTEWEAPIRKALAETPKGTPMLEMGVQGGGSALLLMGLVAETDPSRPIVTVDAGNAPERLSEWSRRLNLKWTHFQMAQAEFVRQNTMDFAYANFDADHNQESCSKDIVTMIPHLVRNAILVKDDINVWDTIPEFEGMKRLDMDVPQGTTLGPHGRHCEQWQKL